MSWFTLIPLAALCTGGFMLSLCVVDICDDATKPDWRFWHSAEVIVYAIGFICTVLTAVYALIHSSIWL